MSNVRLGQEQGREKRLEETREWLGATVLGPCGETIRSGVEEAVFADVVYNEVEAVRTALEGGVDRVECAVSDPAMIAAIKAELLPGELEQTVFLAEEFRTGTCV